MFKDGKLINPEVRIENTNHCNARCIYCTHAEMTRPKTTMCWGVFTNIVDQLYDLGATAISIFGFGEPLIDKGLAEKIEYCSNKKMDTYITTNGSLLNMETAYDILNAGLKNIRFSLHATTPTDYEYVHKKLNWLETFKNFGNFIEINDRLGHPCKIHITCITPNDGDWWQFKAVWGPFCDYLEIWKPHNWADLKTYRKPQLEQKTCGRPFNGPVQIQADGDVIPCCFITDAQVVLGNIHDNTILDILHGDKYKLFQERHKDGDFKDLPCEICDQRDFTYNPLLYSNRDSSREIGKTSSCKIKVF